MMVKGVWWLLPMIIYCGEEKGSNCQQRGIIKYISDILVSGRDDFLWNYSMGFERAYGSHDTGKACILLPKRLSHSDTRYF